ncbi:hypothetical protein [Spiroplasma eriocheiris]|uniref:hypothetical protein n=1 Tax=Spiroplasma eriocheiris TaxID=315358 RepID=UPI00064B2651|nr:hypothetical protein [Spiroplasma eriocheiris]AHF57738.1 hypothetical protein SPE_0610 [Spiroplasma eriocheiris CCTCC M 207170]
MSNKKVIDYWNDDNSYIEPAKRPTSIMKEPTVEPLHDNKRKIENNVESWDDYYNYSATLIDDKVNGSDYDELATDDVITPLRNFKDVEINQSEELGELDDLNLGNKNRFVNDDETNYNKPQPILNVNEMHERWKANKQNSVQARLNFLRNRSQEPKIEGRRKYSFLVPESLADIIKKPTPVVIDATPTAGGDEVFTQRRFFNNPNLIKKVQSQDEENIATGEEKTNSFNEQENSVNPSLQNILQAAKQNMAEVNKEAIFISDDDFLDPDHLTPAQRLKLLKAANDPNDQQRKQILQMKLNRGVMGSLSQVVKERLQKLENGELELVEDANENDDNKK